MRGWVAAALLAAALAGCTTGDGMDDDRPAGSPEWVAGQFWEMTSGYHDVGQRTGDDPMAIDEQGNATIRVQVLAPSLATRRGPVALVLSNYTDEDGDTDEWLSARVPANFSSYGLEPWTALSCLDADICLPPIAGTLHGTAHGMLEFPLRVGKTWSYEEPELPGSGWQARVLSYGPQPTALGLMPTFVVQVHIHYEQADEDGGPPLYWEEGNVTAHYTPAIGYFSSMQGAGQSRYPSFRGDDEPSMTSIRWEWRNTVTRTGVEPTPDLDLLVKRLDLGTTPPSGSIPGDATVRIDQHPGMFDNGTVWTFHATATDLDDLEIQWQLLLVGTANETLVQQGTGATFDARFERPGAYRVEAFAVNQDGQRVGEGDDTRVGARLHLVGTGTCKAGVSPPILEDDSTCTGLKFTVPEGRFVVKGAATFAVGENTLPCAYLAFYADGEEAGRNFIGAGQPALLTIAADVEADTPWELRWVPSASVGSTVAYDVVVEPLGSSGLPGLNGC